MAYYSEASMWSAFLDEDVRAREVPPPMDLPITTQRRNLYGGRIERHFQELYKVPSLTEWLCDCEDWSDLLSTLGQIYGNGRWACYTTAELVMHLGDLDVEPSTYEIMQSSGPKGGLVALGLEPSDKSAERVYHAVKSKGLEVTVSQLESLLCDWGGMNKGTFYAGRNIDRQQGRILKVEQEHGQDLTHLWEVRAAIFPLRTLGEEQGWEGINTKRLKVYHKTKKVLLSHEERT